MTEVDNNNDDRIEDERDDNNRTAGKTWPFVPNNNEDGDDRTAVRAVG